MSSFLLSFGGETHRDYPGVESIVNGLYSQVSILPKDSENAIDTFTDVSSQDVRPPNRYAAIETGHCDSLLATVK